MQIARLCADLETELDAFARHRTPAYLRDALAAGCFVYGAGSYGRRILGLLRQMNIPCHGIIDRKFTAPGGEVAGTPALHPDQVRADQANGTCLVIGVHNHLVDISGIIDYGRRLGFHETLWNADLPDALGPAADNYWLTNRRFMLEHLPHIPQAASRLADERSVKTLLALVRYRVTGAMDAAPAANLRQQYLPPDVVAFGKPINLIDGGAFDGDTFRNLQAGGVAIAHWLAFEPDPDNFAALTAFAAAQPVPFSAFPCGLSDRFQHLPFTARAGAASHLGMAGEDAAITIPCVALDDVIGGQHQDYIKLDIEGAEHQALHGMARTIARDRPHLAVSAYHRPDDLWSLIETLGTVAPYAKLFLRQHGLNAFDSVIYAVP